MGRSEGYYLRERLDEFLGVRERRVRPDEASICFTEALLKSDVFDVVRGRGTQSHILGLAQEHLRVGKIQDAGYHGVGTVGAIDLSHVDHGGLEELKDGMELRKACGESRREFAHLFHPHESIVKERCAKCAEGDLDLGFDCRVAIRRGRDVETSGEILLKHSIGDTEIPSCKFLPDFLLHFWYPLPGTETIRDTGAFEVF